MGADLNITEEELNAVKTEGQAKLDDDAAMWDDRIAEGEKIYNDAIKDIGVQDANGNWTEGSWADKQTDIANKNLDYALDTIEQQRAQAEKDYTKEQSGAWVDYQKQINPYGVNAEKMASMGMTGTGYNESSRVSMYNTYQNRVATAREVFARANLDYDNAIREAQLQNNSALAEIAYQAYQDRLELTLEGFQVKNTLLAQKAESQSAIRNEYFNRWKAILDQINYENALEAEGGIINKDSNSGSNGNDTVSGNNSSSGNERSYHSIESAAYQLANRTHSNASVAKMLDNEVKKGNLTEAQADAIYAKVYKLENSSWTVQYDGADNWFGGINNDAIVRDELGNSHTLEGLKNELIKQGMPKDQAKSYVKSLQKELGIDK